MKKKGKIILKALLDRSEAKEPLFSYLPKEEEKELRSLPSYPSFDLKELLTENSSLSQIHYSWFKEALADIDEEYKGSYLSLFPEKEATKLKKLIGYTNELTKLSPLMCPFFAISLKTMIQKEELLPCTCLPQNELSILLDLDKNKLLELIDLLGIYDLAADLRQIVDKSLLSTIASCLTEKQRNFLQYASKQSLRHLPERMNLKEINGDRAKLNKMLHQRGLQRLASALSLEERDFLWHLLHKLDIGRAKVIEEMMKKAAEKSLVTFFKRQVIALAKKL